MRHFPQSKSLARNGGAFCVAGDKHITGWQHDRRSRHERGYGSAWTKLRDIVMRRDAYLCQPCKRTDRLTQAKQVDHIVPKFEGGTDDLDNLQAICLACHAVKTDTESARAQGRPVKPQVGEDGWPDKERERREVFGFSIPHGLAPSQIPVTIISGPPAAGKSTYVRDNAGPNDLVIDFDDYLERIGAIKWTKDRAQVRQAFRMRDEDLWSLGRRTTGQAWLIATAPTRAERDAWKRALGKHATVTVLNVPAEQCIARINADQGRKHAAKEMIASVRAWHRLND